jgi:hypothetical protein
MVWDTAMQHLAVRVTENGTKSFVVVAWRAGQKHPQPTRTFHTLSEAT